MSTHTKRTSQTTLLIGLDGATFTVLDRFMADGTMPFLRDLIASGVRADLRTVIPALTPPAWTSLHTGQRPGKHGILDFFRREAPDSHYIRMLTGQDVGVDTLAQYVNRFGLRASVFNFPLTYPSPPVDGYVIPGWMPWKQLRIACRPPGLYDQLKAIPGFNPQELAMDMRQEEKAIEGCAEEEYQAWIDLHIRKDRQWLQILRQLHARGPSEYTAILLDGPDKIQHLLWRFIAPECFSPSPSRWELDMRQQCRRYYHALDQVLQEMVEIVGQAATVIVASDHGFETQRVTFFVNTWLERQGLLAWAKDAPQESERAILGIGQLARHTYLLDWEKTRAYAPTPSSNGIHIVQRSQRSPYGVPPAEYEAFRTALVDALKKVTDPLEGQPIVAQVWKREEIFSGPFVELAPDLTLVLRDGGLVSILASDAPVKPRAAPSGTHSPLGILAARGPGLKQSQVLPELSILDVAPLIIYSLGLPIPKEYDGRLPVEAIRPDVLSIHPPQTAPGAAPGATAVPGAAELDPEAQAEIVRRLTAMGYIE